MKINLHHIQTVLFLILIVVSLTSCESDEPSPIETNTKLLTSGTWRVNYVKVDGTDRTDLFTGFKITFQEATYSAEMGGPIWGTSSTWTFTDNTAKAFTIGNGTIVTINEIMTSSLNVTLIWDKTTIDGGRSNSIGGTHEFQFTK